jgi:hypothetical protein
MGFLSCSEHLPFAVVMTPTQHRSKDPVKGVCPSIKFELGSEPGLHFFMPKKESKPRKLTIKQELLKDLRAQKFTHKKKLREVERNIRSLQSSRRKLKLIKG